MAAYGATVSLRKTLSQLLSNQQIRALDVGLYNLQCFLDDNRDVEREFEIRIRDAIYEAEVVLDSHMLSAYFVSPSEAEINNPSFCRELEGLIQSINSIVEMTKLEEFNHPKISNSIWRTSDEIKLAKWTKLVGRDEDVVQLKDRLLGGSEALERVSIVGIAGMGKSNLAKYLFVDKRIDEHFDVCGWCKVPIEYKKRDLLLALLVSMNNQRDEIYQKTDEQLEKHLYAFLKNKRYIVMLDDVRDIVVWNDLKEFFPNHYNGSRILLTTRDEVIACIADSPHRVAPLSNKDTLVLLIQIVFSEEPTPWPRELVVIAKYIAERCRGLPRAVVIVGRLLRCANLSKEYWELVMSSIVTCEGYDDLVQALVTLTYKHLPQYLRACFLYMAMFPYEYLIPTVKLIHLWIAEGFLKMDIERTGFHLEMRAACDCLDQLLKRGLFYYVAKFRSPAKTCGIEDEVFHDFGLRTAMEENFSYIINKDTSDGSSLQKEDGSHNQLRRLFIYRSIIPLITQDFPEHHNLLTSISTVRSLLYYGPEHQYPLRPWLDFDFLKVLDILKIRFYSFPPEILKLLQLRYLSLSYNGQLPAEVCQLHNLQFLIVSRYLSVKYSGAPSFLPVEIWNMTKLTHLQVMGSDIPLNTELILENLFSLLFVSAHSCIRQNLERLPNLRELEVQIESLPEDESLSFFSHLNILDRLCAFRCVVMHPNIGFQVAPCSIPAFPGTLMELTLSGCGFPWEYITAIAALPRLRLLRLQNYALLGPVWDLKKDEFPHLETLWLEDLDLEDWILADECCFLEMSILVIKHCYKMHKIPDAVGDFPKLTSIQVINCSTSAMESMQAIKERTRHRNDSVQILVFSSMDD